MYDIHIITTAIIRPKIHIISFNSLKKIIDINMKILWTINLDFVNTNPQYIKIENISEKYKISALTLCEKNIRKLFTKYNINFIFIKNISGNFNKAVRNITNSAEKFLDKTNYGILYFEDDWISLKSNYGLNYYFKWFKNNKNCLGISLRDNGRIGFKPFFWNKHYFMEVFIKTFQKNKTINIDPETLIRTFNKFKYKEEDLKKNGVYVHKSKYIFFEDIGISWRRSRKMRKWNWTNDITTYS